MSSSSPSFCCEIWSSRGTHRHHLIFTHRFKFTSWNHLKLSLTRQSAFAKVRTTWHRSGVLFLFLMQAVHNGIAPTSTLEQLCPGYSDSWIVLHTGCKVGERPTWVISSSTRPPTKTKGCSFHFSKSGFANNGLSFLKSHHWSHCRSYCLTHTRCLLWSTTYAHWYNQGRRIFWEIGNQSHAIPPPAPILPELSHVVLPKPFQISTLHHIHLPMHYCYQPQWWPRYHRPHPQSYATSRRPHVLLASATTKPFLTYGLGTGVTKQEQPSPLFSLCPGAQETR